MDVSKATDYTKAIKSGPEEKVEKESSESGSQNPLAWKEPAEVISMLWYSSNGS